MFCFNLNCLDPSKEETFLAWLYSLPQPGWFKCPSLGSAHNRPGSSGKKLNLPRTLSGKYQVGEDHLAIVHEQLDRAGIDKEVESQPSVACSFGSMVYLWKS